MMGLDLGALLAVEEAFAQLLCDGPDLLFMMGLDLGALLAVEEDLAQLL